MSTISKRIFDSRNNIIQETNDVGTTYYEYDDIGRLVTIKFQNGNIEHRSYGKGFACEVVLYSKSGEEVTRSSIDENGY